MNEKIMPFLWMQGAERSVLESEIESIYNAGCRAFIVESRTHPEFCGEGWWRDMDVVLAKAEELGMRVWVLDDKHYPTGFANDKVLEHPEAAQLHIAERIADVYGGKNKRLRVLGYRFEDTLLYAAAYPYKGNKIDYESPIELSDNFKNCFLFFDLPEAPYRIVTIWKTHEGGRKDRIDMINPESVGLLIDVVYEPHYDRYNKLFGNTLAGFFTDEPGFFNDYNISNLKKEFNLYENKLGTEGLAYPVSDELLNRLYSLPLGVKSSDLIALWVLRNERDSEIRCAYMDILTDLYSEHFSGNIGKWCAEHGVQYIGHVVEDMNCHVHLGMGAGHYFKSQRGQNMAGIDIVLHQIEPAFGELKHYAPVTGGFADPTFFDHTLSTLAFSDANIDPYKNGNSMCEIFGAYGWNLDISKMKRLVDLMLVGGINHFMPHAFCPSFPNPDCPPHFHAQGNNPQEAAFGYLMNYVSYVCDLFSNGKPVVNIGVLYHAEAAWSGREYVSVDTVLKLLHENQYNAFIVPSTHLDFANVKVLIVPYAEFLPKETLDRIKKLHCKVIYAPKDDLFTVLSELNCMGLRDVEFDHQEKYLRYYHYRKDGADYYMFYNSGMQRIHVRVNVNDNEKYKIVDYLSEYAYSSDEDGVIELDLAAGSSVLCARGTCGKKREFTSCGRLNEGVRVSLKTAKEKEFSFYKTVKLPFDVLAACEIPNFAGTARFEADLPIKRGKYLVNCNCNAGDVVLSVNGQTVGRRICKPYMFNISEYLTDGENQLRIDVSGTLGVAIEDWLSCYTETEPLGLESIEILKLN